MIFDKLFGKKKEENESLPVNDLNKIKKAIYQPKPNTAQKPLLSNDLPFPNKNNGLLNINNSNNANNNLIGNDFSKNNLLNNSLNNQPLPQNNTFLNNTNENNTNDNLNNSLPLPAPTQNALETNKNEVNLADLSIEDELKKLTEDNNQNILPLDNTNNNVNSDKSLVDTGRNLTTNNSLPNSLSVQQDSQLQALPQSSQTNNLLNNTVSGSAQQLQQLQLEKEQAVVKSSNKIEEPKKLVSNDLVNTEGVVLNVEEKKENNELNFSNLKRKEKVEIKKETNEDEEEVLFIRLDKYEETLKLIENIKKKIEENESLLEKIVELKREEDIKLERWRNELTKINKHLIKIYTTLKK
jgi:hypothetical protein